MPIEKSRGAPTSLVARIGQLAVGVLCTLSCACASDVDVVVHRSPGYASQGARMSVLGVFKNGRMDPAEFEAWRDRVGPVFGAATCVPGFGDAMEKSAPDLYSDLDEETRNDGISEEALEKVASRADGDDIVVLEVFGAPRQKKKTVDDSAVAPTASMGRRGRGRGRMPAPASDATAETTGSVELAVSVYSVRAREEVAAIDVKATADKSDEATAEFGDKLRALLAGSSCSGWTWGP